MFNNVKDFYPTTPELIEKMLTGLNFKLVESVLEPSAGRGDIVSAIREKAPELEDIDCIEINSEMRSILNGKEFRVVHDNFLTYNTMKEYSLIVMNPPFSSGSKHLLKALEMQEKSGGGLICLLNAETLKNPCTHERLALKRKLADYDAYVEFIENAFAKAEHRSLVEVALIKVNFPEKRTQSIIFERLRKAQEEELEENVDCSQLSDANLFKSIVNQYQLEVKAGIELIKEYRAMAPYILTDFAKDEETGETVQRGSCILDLKLSKDNGYYSELSVNKYVKAVRKKYWEALFENKKFTGQLTRNLQSELYARVNQMANYEFSLYNIYELKVATIASIKRGVEDTIIELFDELGNKYHWYDEMSSNIHYYNGWKTNKAYIVNKKVIIPLQGWYQLWDKEWNFKPNSYEVISKLKDIEKCFNYLDGGLTEARNLENSLHYAAQVKETRNIKLKYFNVTFYKKGTCHIVFTNEELLKKFNIFGSQHKGWLPPPYGKKTYNEMTDEEKSVIDEFEGEKVYIKVLANKEYYLYEGTGLNLLEFNENGRI